MEYHVISIGALSHHDLRPVDHGSPRTPHATTVLIRSGDKMIVVDPGLPGPAVGARLSERAGLTAEDVTHVFLTNFRPAHRRGLDIFTKAQLLISETERETVGKYLVEQFRENTDDEMRELLQHDIALLKRFVPAPDKIAPQVDLFPLPGFTPGTTGLLLSHATRTTLIAGDAIATRQHLEQGRVLRTCYDANQAQESFVEAVEIADLIIPGHDNITFNETRGPY